MDDDQTARTRAVVKDYFDRFMSGDVHGAFGLFAPDASYDLPGRSPLAGSRTIPEMAPMFEKLGPVLAGMKMTVGPILADGNRAAVQSTGTVELPNGKVYDNEYHWAFEVEGDRIKRIREYMCTYHATEVLAPLMGE